MAEWTRERSLKFWFGLVSIILFITFGIVSINMSPTSNAVVIATLITGIFALALVVANAIIYKWYIGKSEKEGRKQFLQRMELGAMLFYSGFMLSLLINIWFLWMGTTVSQEYLSLEAFKGLFTGLAYIPIGIVGMCI